MPPVDLPDSVNASFQQRSILDILIDAYPRKVRGESIVDALYSCDANGGAEYARIILSVQMGRLRKKLAGTGWTIPKLGGGRGNVGFYSIVEARS